MGTNPPIISDHVIVNHDEEGVCKVTNIQSWGDKWMDNLLYFLDPLPVAFELPLRDNFLLASFAHQYEWVHCSFDSPILHPPYEACNNSMK